MFSQSVSLFRGLVALSEKQTTEVNPEVEVLHGRNFIPIIFEENCPTVPLLIMFEVSQIRQLFAGGDQKHHLH